ncbi:MAG: RNA 2',3'-cyclic phosphodiesterase [Candidatus Methanosuratus sp.]|nr:RNA 2',3'-cyclic phosphodiesterase [Candidatus Methanosuratincola sp.]
MESVRAFFALEISDDMRGRIADLEEEVARSGADVKVVEAENLHVTMKFLGEIPTSMVEEIAVAVEGIKARKFELEARGAGAFPDRRVIRVIWVGVGRGDGEATEIARKLDAALERFGFQKEKRFVPHITVGRVRSQRNRDALLRILEDHAQTVFGTTLVDRLVLKKSVLTGKGPVYTDLKVFPFE